MKSLLLAGLLAAPVLACAQRTALNLPLKHELDSLYYVDQVYREAIFADNKQHLVDSIAASRHLSAAQVSQQLGQFMVQTDATDLQRVRAIIQRYGYPGKSLVGTPTNQTAFYVIQHSDAIAEYLPLIKRAADQGELPFRLYAMMFDRQLMREGKPQIYGTQGRTFDGQAYFIWPIEDPAHVNERRQQAGFDSSVEANAKRLHIDYHPLTLEQVKRMPGYRPLTD